MAKKKNISPLWRSSANKKLLYQLIEENEEVILFDVETSGLNVEKDRIIQLSGIKYHPEDDLFEEIGRINLYVRPPFQISDKIVELTGITNEFLATQRGEDEVFDEILSFFGETPSLSAYTSPFDIRFLKELYKRHSVGFIVKTELDVLAMARDLVLPEETVNYKLGTISELFGADEGLSFHNSMDDIIATSRLLQIFIKKYREKDAEDQKVILEAQQLEKKEKSEVNIISMRYWPGYKGFARIYVNTSIGTLYYDIRSKNWGEKDLGILDKIDMEKLRIDAYELAGATNEIEFAAYRGGVA
jgi:DNA polymerase III alpha subunit (gram-positive type)